MPRGRPRLPFDPAIARRDRENPSATLQNRGQKNPRKNRRLDPRDIPEVEFRNWRMIYDDGVMEHRRELLAQNLAIAGMSTLEALRDAGFKVGKRMESEIPRVEHHLKMDKVLQARIRELTQQRGNDLTKASIDNLIKLGLEHSTVLGPVMAVMQQSLAPATYDRDGVLKAAELLGKHLGSWDKANSAGGNTDPRLIALARTLEGLNLAGVDRLLKVLGAAEVAVPKLVTINGESVPEPAQPEMKADSWKDETTALKR